MVLAMIALIIGAILVGREMIRNTEIIETYSRLQEIEGAINLYSSKYNALPGDHAHATQFWPGQTNDGNGDQRVYDHSTSSPITDDEDAKASQHLALAGLIKLKPFTTPYYPHVIGVNMLAAPIQNAGYRFESQPYDDQHPTARVYGRSGLIIWLATPVNCYDLACPIVTAQESLLIDQKYDNGLPATGSLVGANWNVGYSSDCNLGSIDNGDGTDITFGNNQYNLSTSGIACAMGYWVK